MKHEQRTRTSCGDQLAGRSNDHLTDTPPDTLDKATDSIIAELSTHSATIEQNERRRLNTAVAAAVAHVRANIGDSQVALVVDIVTT